MKRKKYYTLILASNDTGAVRKIRFPQKALKFSLTGLGFLSLLLTLFLTDYFGLIRQGMEIRNLRNENKKLKANFARTAEEFQELKQEVFQLRDFNRKVSMIADLGVSGDTPHRLSYGKTSILSSLTPLSRPELQPVPSPSPSKEAQKCPDSSSYSVTYGELKTEIQDLKAKSRLVKQNTWEIYSSLLESKTLLNGTPSILPVQGGWITSRYGFRNETIYADHDPQFHNGMDIAAREGRPVMATADGCVRFTGYDKGYGKLIVMDHGNDVTTYYAHLSDITVKSGQCVKRGEAIAAVGNTGKSTGPHLHYEVRVLGVPVNPAHYILDENHIAGLSFPRFH